MTFSLADVDARTALLRDFEGADVASLPRPQLLALLRAVGEVKAACDRLTATVAGEIGRRSAPEDGASGLARQEGFASAEQMVASVIGASPSDGHKLVRAGKALGTVGAVGESLRDNTLSVDKADLIARTLAPLEGDTGDLEARLTRAAQRLDYRQLGLVCRREAARFDVAHTEAVERRHHEQRSLDITEGLNGLVHIDANLPAAQGAIVITYLDAQVKAALQARRAIEGDTAASDTRTATQMRADALVALAAHGLDCESPATGVKATIILRINDEDLVAESGTATCDALSTPISLSAFHQLCMDATVLRMVVNSRSQCLDAGREVRLFSWIQRMALAERDGGCAKCHAPISHCIAHHIRWWKRDSGPTDISNGVLLCVRCHTAVHRDGWEIHVDSEHRVWFTPPAHVDPGRRRRLGGLAALAA